LFFFREMENYLPRMDLIFNTVPEILLDSSNLNLVPPSALIIDLASAPNGVDASAARALGRRVLFGRSLPGEVAPSTTAKYILQTVEQIVLEREGRYETA
jgi:dipicolinate synthase subunit A